jgi:hypothetical protein
MKTKTIIGHHRSAALAEAHRRRLELKHRVPVEIVARRNSRGKFSQRGRTFVFKFAKVEKEKGPLKEWAVVWQYSSKESGTRSLDFIAIAKSKERALQLAFEAVENGEDSKGNPVSWAEKIPWDTQEVLPVKGKRKFRKESIRIR